MRKRPAPFDRLRALKVRGLVLLTLAGFVMVGVTGAGSATTAKPDLIVVLPSAPYATQSAPIYVDRFTQPGSLLYRFDAVLFNRGGMLDVFRDAASGRIMQAIWAGGLPSVAPDPNAPPPAGAPGLTLENLSARGARFRYISGVDHNHFHFEGAARYQLVVPGFGTLPAAKVGFCFGDDWGTPPTKYFPYPYTGPGMSWCAVGHPEATFFREGISPQAGDLYNSQVQDQWIDVTGLRPGSYTLRGTANPDHVIDESDEANNTTNAPRAIPGVMAQNVAVPSVKGTTIPLRAAIVAPLIPARVSANCFPRSGSPACLSSDSTRHGLNFKLQSSPCFGKASIKPTGPSSAAATYRPRSSAASIDGFAYVARDARGLVSPPGFVRIGRPRATGAPVACLLGGNIGPDGRARLTFTTSGKPPVGTHWGLFVDAHFAKSALTGSTATSAPLLSGRTLFWLELVKKRRPLSSRVQSREITLDVPARLKAPG